MRAILHQSRISFISLLAVAGFFIAPTTARAQTAHVLQLTLTGEQNGDVYGFAVANVGDLNGDGFSDFAVGAPLNDGTGQLDCGRVYVYLGGPALRSAPIVLTGAAAGDRFGSAIAGAGDVNGDGYQDFLVGAPGADSHGIADAGAAYLYFGAPALTTGLAAAVTYLGSNTGDAFGSAVGSADVNGDGFTDVIVGAPFNGGKGSAYLYLGAPAPSAAVVVTYVGIGTNDHFGAAVSGGLFEAYPYQTVLIGAPFSDATGLEAGRVSYFYGTRNPSGSPAANSTFSGAASDTFGFAIATATSPSNTYVYGVPGSDFAGTASGRIVGAANVSGEVPGDQFGFSVGLTGNLPFDIIVIVGAPGSDATGVDAGRAYVLFGGGTDFKVSGGAAGDRLGAAVSGLGDVNGDGFADVLVGAPQNGPGATGPGHAYLYDINRYILRSPNGGETWQVGSLQTISWLGAMPADVWLSTDGGVTYDRLESQVGGSNALNSISIRIPHRATRFGCVRITPSLSASSTTPTIPARGRDMSDAFFTIQTSVAVIAFEATPTEGGVALSWQSEPAVGPQGIAGYRLYRLAPEAADNGVRIGPDLITDNRYLDAGGAAGSRYRLAAVNGLMEEQEIGHVSAALVTPLLAWPAPYRGGTLNVEFATASDLGGGPAAADVGVFDLQGRRVATLVRGSLPAGQHSTRWTGLDDGGAPVGNGLYFIRSMSLGVHTVQKLVVAR